MVIEQLESFFPNIKKKTWDKTPLIIKKYLIIYWNNRYESYIYNLCVTRNKLFEQYNSKILDKLKPSRHLPVTDWYRQKLRGTSVIGFPGYFNQSKISNLDIQYNEEIETCSGNNGTNKYYCYDPKKWISGLILAFIIYNYTHRRPIILCIDKISNNSS
ncbi:hypothetical protein ACR3K2_14100 [Cryptosporidium serpentis]